MFNVRTRKVEFLLASLADFKAALDEDTFLSAATLDKRFNQRKKSYEWTSDMDQVVAQKSIFVNLAAAIKNWVDKQARFPRFKRRGKKESFTTNNQFVEVRGKYIKLPKIGWVRMHQSLRAGCLPEYCFVGKIIKVTISRTAHRWFVSITVEVEDTEAVDTSTHPIIGIDVGINTLATCSDGTQYENPRPLQCLERKLARAQRKLSRQVPYSKNWFKQKLKVAKLHYRIVCIRRDAHHKASTDIVNRASGIVIETLKVSNLLKNRKLAKALSDSALGGFLSLLKTKAEARGILVTEASQFFASSKTCSSCGKPKKTDLTLSERTYHCSECGVSIDRDLNAAINLRNLAAGHAESQNACGVQVIPFLLIILSLPVVSNETENGRPKLEVYATIKCTNWKFMLL